MKTDNHFFLRESAFIAVLFTFTLWGCNKPMTKSDVQDKVDDARQSTKKAQEETQDAIDARMQYTADYKETKIAELEDRSKEIDNRISDLEKTVKKSSNKDASADIRSAIREFQDEKKDINGKIEDVKDIKNQDWSSSYDELNNAIGKIEGEIDKLSKSLENNN